MPLFRSQRQPTQFACRSLPLLSRTERSTCIVEINAGLEDCTVRSLDESSTLRDNPANYRLSCVTDMYDDVTVTVFPPVGAAQWTR